MIRNQNENQNKNIKILFDLCSIQPIGNTKRHGGGKYGEIVFSRIVERQLPVSCFYDSNKWINPDILSIIHKNNIELFDISNNKLQDIINKGTFPVLFSPLPNRLKLPLVGIKVIGTVHGLRRLETPADRFCFLYKNVNTKEIIIYLMKTFLSGILTRKLRKRYLRDWLDPNYQIVAVSNHTSNAIKYFFPELKNREIPVFYSPSTSSSKELFKRHTKSYFLMVSGNRCEKNNLRAIMAFDRLFTMGYLQGFQVKITGTKNSSNYRYKIQNVDRFDFLGYVDEEELEQLYHDAYCFVYPSLNEGFGYPPLEAMHYGVPVLASSYSSINEVCQGAVMYFNPFAIEEIANRILQIENKEIRERYSKLAKEQYLKITEMQKKDLDGLIDFIFNYNN